MGHGWSERDAGIRGREMDFVVTELVVTWLLAMLALALVLKLFGVDV